MATPDPYQHWSGAPKHWVHVPAQRSGPPGPDELDAAAGSPGGEYGRASRGGWTVAAIALAVAVAAFVLIGTGSAMTGHEAPPPQDTPGVVIR
ncbi:hypothetical protein FHX44_111421 [Pseudonocardia hierapolitana]|uniref:Uncharacterized protein n=1 Tax=Pseudonocardia hierapolitana TaxID=1128676 RepID=A0A561SL03_9PSEU|nr:hypothetical protein [Pseudonocardia hierapolitana]TWF75537.1 hypothetical protein FHX44_111421 [Pseudonocardia hierapolitana]